MKWLRVWRCAVSIIFGCSFVGCSQQDAATTGPAAESATVSCAVTVGEPAEEGARHVATEALTSTSPHSDEQTKETTAEETVADNPFARATATRPDQTVEQHAVAPPERMHDASAIARRVLRHGDRWQ